MRHTVIAILFSLVAFVGCKTSTPPPTNSSQASVENTSPASNSPNQQVQPAPANESAVVKAKIDACSLLSGTEIESVQGEAVKETKLSGQSVGGFSISQCFFTLPTFTNSISLLVAQKGEDADAKDPKDFWRSNFYDDKPRNKHTDSHEKGEEKEESAPPQKISDVGDEAFWMGNQVAGALYVLKGNAYVRVSIGGPANDASKKRLKTLAQKAIARL